MKCETWNLLIKKKINEKKKLETFQICQKTEFYIVIINNFKIINKIIKRYNNYLKKIE